MTVEIRSCTGPSELSELAVMYCHPGQSHGQLLKSGMTQGALRVPKAKVLAHVG